MSRAADSRATVLVAEDDYEIRTLFSEVLENAGYKVFPVSTGIDAVKQGIRDRPDALLVDVNMPGATGIEAGRTMRQLFGTPFSVATAFPTERELAEKSGAVAFLSKPILNPMEIIEHVEKMLHYCPDISS